MSNSKFEVVFAIAGLPIRPGGASVTLPATATLYQPAN
jgi:hypothetical protein